jgi:hypothetical protein
LPSSLPSRACCPAHPPGGLHRVIIEQAKGALAQYSGLATDLAFDRLRHYARSHHIKLSDLAQRIVAKQFDPAEVLAPTVPEQRL